jgi:iron complex transport system substrate-binding protein
MKGYIFGIFIILSFAVGAAEIKGNYIYGNGNEKIEKKDYKRIVVLNPAYVETAFMLGAEEKIIAIGETKTTPIWPEEKTNKLDNVGTITKPSLESVLSKKPDLVILNPMIIDFGDNLKQQKIPYITIDAKSIEEIFRNIEIAGVIFGKTKEASILIEEKKRKLSKIDKEIDKKPLNMKGAFIYSVTPFMGFGGKTLSGEILKILGVINIAENIDAAKPILSPEFILKENPDFLIGAMSIKSKEDIINGSPLIKNTKAIKNKNVFLVASDKLLRPSPRIFDEIEILYNELRKLKK